MKTPSSPRELAGGYEIRQVFGQEQQGAGGVRAPAAIDIQV